MWRSRGRSAGSAVVMALLTASAVVASIAYAVRANNTLHVVLSGAETGFDPQALSDDFSWTIADAIFEAPYKYDYFARPLRLVLNTASGMPEITEEGRTYTVHIRPGIFFADDAAFKGRRRELTAADYVFAFKRILDPKVHSPFLYLFEHRLAGLDDVLARARKDGELDYNVNLEGLKTLDRYSFRIRFKDPNYGFQYWLTSIPFVAVAREVVEAYEDSGRRVMENPVGTGPYRLVEWRRGQRMVLEANPNFREELYPAPPVDASPADAAIAKGLSGRRLPLAPRVEVSIVEEDQPRLLGFRSGQFDYVEVPSASIAKVLDGDTLKPEFLKSGVTLHRTMEAALSFTFFNMEDPVVGGYAPDKVALRRAIAMAYDREAEVRILRNDQARVATQLVPPAVPGYDPARIPTYRFDPAGARALLERFGYKVSNRGGYRTMPDGRPLVLTMLTTPDSASRQYDELWKRNLDAIGIRITFVTQKWSELNKMASAGKLQMWSLGMSTPIPDADLFYSMLYSGTIGELNYARFRLPAFDRAYEASTRLADGPGRFALFREMDALLEAYAPLILNAFRYRNFLAQPWLKGFKQNIFTTANWAFYTVERP
jgi:ABC-type transport system substrate-binding protein